MVSATLAISMGIGAAMTAIECVRAFYRVTALAETPPTNPVRPVSTQAAQSRPRRRWVVAPGPTARRTLIVPIHDGAEAQPPDATNAGRPLTRLARARLRDG